MYLPLECGADGRLSWRCGESGLRGSGQETLGPVRGFASGFFVFSHCDSAELPLFPLVTCQAPAACLAVPCRNF